MSIDPMHSESAWAASSSTAIGDSNRCPHCESTDCRSFKIIHEAGTGSATTSASGYSGREHVSASGSSRFSTQLASRCAPPSGGSGIFSTLVFLAVLGLTVAVGIWTFQYFGIRSNWWWLAVGPAAFLASATACYPLMWLSQKLDEPHKAALAKWSVQWMCMRCGKDFEAPEAQTVPK